MTKILIALGGNALILPGERGTIEEQLSHLNNCTSHIARLAAEGHTIIITHGNGPTVGNLLLKNELAKDLVPPMPLYICDADSQGEIGYMIQQSLYNHLKKLSIPREIAVLSTQVLVDPKDPSFQNPTKPIGPYYTENQAMELIKKGWKMKKLKEGYRRLVPSPIPKKIIESSIIEKLINQGVIVIAVGGGGIPVIETPDCDLRGIDAVIDKDLASSLLAREMKVELFLILTTVEKVYTDYRGKHQMPLEKLSIEQAKKYLKNGEFPQGSMGPKIQAAIEFIEGGGGKVIITLPRLLEKALKGMAGTTIS